MTITKNKDLDSTLPYVKDVKGGMSVDTANLQAACMFSGGRTETTLNATKVPGIRMWWVAGEGLYFSCKEQCGIIPSTNVKIVYLKGELKGEPISKVD